MTIFLGFMHSGNHGKHFKFGLWRFFGTKEKLQMSKLNMYFYKLQNNDDSRGTPTKLQNPLTQKRGYFWAQHEIMHWYSHKPDFEIFWKCNAKMPRGRPPADVLSKLILRLDLTYSRINGRFFWGAAAAADSLSTSMTSSFSLLLESVFWGLRSRRSLADLMFGKWIARALGKNKGKADFHYFFSSLSMRILKILRFRPPLLGSDPDILDY